MKELLPLLPRPSRYLGNEWGATLKDLSTVSGRIALAFPDLYEVGMSYLGQKILLAAINERKGLYAERVYSPCQEAAGILRAHSTPLATMETDTLLAQLDAVGFSLTHELCFTNVLDMYARTEGTTANCEAQRPASSLRMAAGRGLPLRSSAVFSPLPESENSNSPNFCCNRPCCQSHAPSPRV